MEQRIHTYQFTEARNNFTAIIDLVQSNLPQVIKKRKQSEDNVLIISASLLRDMLIENSKHTLNMKSYQEPNHSWTITLEPFGLAVNAKTKEKALEELIEDVKLYAGEFIDRRAIYLHSPNRKNHFPLVLQIILCTNDDEIRNLICGAKVS